MSATDGIGCGPGGLGEKGVVVDLARGPAGDRTGITAQQDLGTAGERAQRAEQRRADEQRVVDDRAGQRQRPRGEIEREENRLKRQRSEEPAPSVQLPPGGFALFAMSRRSVLGGLIAGGLAALGKPLGW